MRWRPFSLHPTRDQGEVISALSVNVTRRLSHNQRMRAFAVWELCSFTYSKEMCVTISIPPIIVCKISAFQIIVYWKWYAKSTQMARYSRWICKLRFHACFSSKYYPKPQKSSCDNEILHYSRSQNYSFKHFLLLQYSLSKHI